MKRKVIVFEGTDGWPYRLGEFSAWLAGLTQQIPPEHRETAWLDLDPEESYGDPYVNVRVWYSREETDEEEEARRLDEERALLQQEAKELQLLAKLKKKYEEGGTP